jgi:hypothetical protein
MGSAGMRRGLAGRKRGGHLGQGTQQLHWSVVLTDCQRATNKQMAVAASVSMGTQAGVSSWYSEAEGAGIQRSSRRTAAVLTH